MGSLWFRKEVVSSQVDRVKNCLQESVCGSGAGYFEDYQ